MYMYLVRHGQSVGNVRRTFHGQTDYPLTEEGRRQARQAAEKLREGRLKEPSEHIVLDHKGRPYSPNALSLAFTRFVRKNDLPRVTLHGLRHSFASIAHSRNVPLFGISKALGHSNTNTTTQIYMHLFDETHLSVVQEVGRAIGER